MYNQEIVYKKDSNEVEKFDFDRYILKYDEVNDRYYVEFNGEIVYLYVWAKLNDNTYRHIFADYNGVKKPVIMKAGFLDGDVDYLFYCVYPLGEENPFTNKLFILDWNRDAKLTCQYNEENDYYEWFRVEEIYKPFMYIAENNSEYGYDKDIVLPNVLEENVKDGVVQFLDEDLEREILPEYMNAEVNSWKSDTLYKVGDKVSYEEKIYKCLQEHLSENSFDTSKWSEDGYLKNYEPCLPIYYGIPNSHNTILKTINAYEKKGHYWYGRKFVFFELHFSPRMKNNIDNFTICFYNDINNNSPEFLLI